MINDPVLLNDWHPVASVEEFDEKQLIGTRLLQEDIVIWRAGEKFCAWQDLCVHRGTKLSLGKILEGERVQCPYHGWVYNDEGRCTHIPAMPDHAPPERARVKTYQVQQRYGWIWVCMGEPGNDVPEFPEWENNKFRKILCGPYRVQASGPRIVENFLDVAHFPYVHENILGTQSHTEIEDYDVTIGSEHAGVEATNVRVYQPDPYGTGQGDTVAYTYRVYRPLTAYLLKESEGPQFSILLSITPHSPTESSAWMWMAMNYGHDIPEQELVDWQNEIFAQDQPIVQSQRPELLPLDLQAELNMRCDRTAVNYRRWLRELGMTFGVA